jgi:hypothetical protein
MVVVLPDSCPHDAPAATATDTFSASSSVGRAASLPGGRAVAGPIAGLDLATPQANVGLTATVTWDAPAIGVPTCYSVRLRQVGVNGATTTARVVATFSTTANIADASGHVAVERQLVPARDY